MEEAKQELTIVHDIPPATSLNSICPILIGVAGGSASGKTTLCNTIISEIGESECLIISLDSFYKPLTEEEAIGFNFDHPDALDFDLCYEVIKKLLTRQTAEVPIYNFKTNTREKETQRVEPTDIILLEGILALYNPVTKKLVSLMNIKLFVDCDNDIRLYRRTLRDIKERGRDVTSILYAYNKFVKPAFDELIKPTMNHANLIIPGRGENAVAIRFIVQNMKMQLARVKEMKKLMNNNAYYADILDSCWVNIKNNQEDSEELRLRQLDNITFLMDQNARVECLRILDVFDNPFSDTLYVVLMVKYLQHGLDLMKNHKAAKTKKFRLVYYIDGVFDREDHLTSAPVIGVIVPFLYEATFASTQQKLNQISKMNPGSKIFVISIFSDLDSLTNLSHGKEKAFMINILCIVDMKALLVRLEKNCEASGVDFLNHKLLAKVMIETGELQKDEPETESDLTKKIE